MLPSGSQLHGVMFPRYDESHRLSSVVKVRDMTLIDENTYSGQTVSIEFFDSDQKPSGRVDMIRAVFDQDKGKVVANGTVTFRSDRIQAKGTGLTFTQAQAQAKDQNHNKGFLLGPCVTCVQQPPTETSMNPRPAPFRAAAIVGMSLASLPLAATPPPAVGTDELARIHADSASKSATAKQSADTAKTNLATDTADAAAAAKDGKEYADQAGIKITEDPLATAPTKPLDITPGPTDTVVQCDNGMYFDAEEGVVVYFGNVRVTDPRYNMNGANEMKVFLSKKPGNEQAKTSKKEATPAPGAGIQDKFGDVDRIVATGAVRVLQKNPDPGKEPVEASGAILTYKPKTGEMVLSGGYPWVKQGASFMRAKQPNLNLRVLKDGSYVTEGNWDMGGNLQQKDKH